jgi:hypothetical protein
MSTGQVDLLALSRLHSSAATAAAARKAFPLASTLTAYEVVLSPGDTLYLPPLWLHAVEAVDLSVSVNVWSLTKESEVVEQVLCV